MLLRPLQASLLEDTIERANWQFHAEFPCDCDRAWLNDGAGRWRKRKGFARKSDSYQAKLFEPSYTGTKQRVSVNAKSRSRPFFKAA